MSTSESKLREYLKMVTAELRETRQRLHAAESLNKEPVAIVGMGCRFPGGVGSAEDLWSLVDGGTDAVSGFPDDRGWDVAELFDPTGKRRGTSYVREAGFLDDAAGFDAGFFGISPREALAMDPQQRLVLEVAWEALERAGLDPSGLKGANVGTYIGTFPQDYGSSVDQAPQSVEGFVLTGRSASVLSGRISYTLGLRGPAVTVDTACSSSLVAMHLACRSLRDENCTLALAGGVTIMSRPDAFVEFSRQRGLAPDGRCKAYADGADGTNWGEGVGVVVLERLSDARRNGHEVLAVIRGSAINQDGASNGLTAPNDEAQEQVIRDALAAAGIDADGVDAVEGHGTGTALGDPIEAQALLETYGRGRRGGAPLYLGSLKSNVGHAQAAAGVGGVIKMVMAMRHGVLPRSLHAEVPSSHVDWSSGGVEVLSRALPWPDRDRPRRAGVSAFGISGTNAHVILEQAPRPEPRAEDADDAEPGGVIPWVLSARTPAALRAQAERLLSHMEDNEPGPRDVGFSLATTRGAWNERAVALGRDRGELLAGLRDIATAAPGALRGTVASGRTAFLFAGQGGQRAGMGRQLYESQPVFAAAFDEAAEHLDGLLGRSLRQVLFDGEAELIDRTGFAQPTLFTVEVALFRLLESWGVEPDVLCGHSVGEIAAAHVSGVLSLADACVLVAARGRLMQDLPEGGLMVAVRSGEDEVRDLLPTGVDVAAVNGPESVVVSGDADGVAEVARVLETRGRKVSRLNVSHAFHSPLMEPMLDEFKAVLSGLSYGSPRLPLVSTVTGELVPDGLMASAEYWVRHARETVRFHDGVRVLEAEGTSTFVELGPDGVLSGAAAECVTGEAVFTPTLRPGRDENDTVTETLGRLWTRGATVDWSRAFPRAAVVDLPTYAFQHQRYWLNPSTASTTGADEHPLRISTVVLADGDGVVSTAVLSRRTAPWLADHVVGGRVLVPGTTYVELVCHAGDAIGRGRIADLTFESPLALTESDRAEVQVRVGKPEDEAGDATERRPVEVYSRPLGGDEPWTRHASGTVTSTTSTQPDVDEYGLAQWPPEGARPVDVAEFYSKAADVGYEYGQRFRGITAAWRRGDELFTEVVLPDAEEQAERYGMHPALLDAALQGMLTDRFDRESGRLFLPFAVSGVELFAAGASSVRVRLTPNGTDSVRARIADSRGRPVARAESLSMREVSRGDSPGERNSPSDRLLHVKWEPVPVPANPAGDRCTLLTGWNLAESPRPAPEWVAVPIDETAGSGIGEVMVAVLELVRQWLDSDRFARSCLVFALPGDGPVSAGVAGFLRAVRLEHPGRFGLLHTDGPVTKSAVDTGVAILATGEPEVRVGAGEVAVPRLDRVDPAAAAPPGWDSGKTVLVTGGTGTLGGLLARHLVTRHGVRRLVLTGRRGPAAEGATELAAELRSLGAEVNLVACDVSDRESVRALLRGIPEDAPLGAVVHAAGVVDDATVERLTAEQTERVLRAKAEAAAHLDELTAETELDAFVLFSSLAGVIGAAGQANYAAANAYLDGLARDRRRRGLPATALAWGLWRQASGITGRLGGRDLDRLAGAGVAALDSAEGLDLFDAALATGEPTVVAARLDPVRLREQAGAGELPALFRRLVPVPRRRAADPAARQDGAEFKRKLAESTEAERRGLVLDLVRSHAAVVLRLGGGEDLGVNQTFRDAGFDSLTAVELRNGLNKTLGLRLPSTVVFDHPSPAELAERLRTELVTDVEVSGSVDEWLDRFEAALAASPSGEQARDRIAKRLRDLLWTVDRDAAVANGVLAEETLASASDDEMFALIDKELGAS